MAKKTPTPINKLADPNWRLRRNWLAYLLAGGGAILIFGVVIGVFLRAGGWDDAYITYVFAENVAEGHGFVWYEGGPRVYGSSTITYTLLLALLGRLGLDIPTMSIVMSGLFWAGAYLVLFYLLKERVGALAGLIAVALGAGTVVPLVMYSLGLETGLYVFLILSVFALYAAGRPTLALLLGVVLVLTRLDGALVPALILLHFLLVSGQGRVVKTLKVAWPSALLLALSATVLTWYFGGPLPSSFLAKTTFDESVSGRFEPTRYLELSSVLFGTSGPFGTNLFAIALPTSETGLFVNLFAIALLAFGTVGFVRAVVRWRDPATLVVLWIPFYVAMFYFSGMPQHGWYHVPVFPALYAAFAYGVSWPMKHLSEQVRMPTFRYLLVPSSIVVLVLVAAMLWRSAENSHQFYAEKDFDQANEMDYRYHLAQAIVTDMESLGMKQADVVAYEVGHMGYQIPGRVHDILGLVSPDSLEHGGYKNPLYLIEAHDPDYVVITENPSYPHTAPILNSEVLRTEYSLLYSHLTDPTKEWGQIVLAKNRR